MVGKLSVPTSGPRRYNHILIYQMLIKASSAKFWAFQRTKRQSLCLWGRKEGKQDLGVSVIIEVGVGLGGGEGKMKTKGKVPTVRNSEVPPSSAPGPISGAHWCVSSLLVEAFLSSARCWPECELNDVSCQLSQLCRWCPFPPPAPFPSPCLEEDSKQFHRKLPGTGINA